MSITSSSTGSIFTPNEVLYDPTNKLRVSQPQSLIDTDFEYGTQVSKWENLGLIDNRPFAFQSPTQVANIASITQNVNSKTVTVVLSSGTAPANGTAITVQDTFLSIANGNFTIDSGGGTGTFTYTARATNNTVLTALFDSGKTAIYQGTLYTNASIGATGSAIFTIASNRVTVTTVTAHGLSIGNEIAITGITGTNPPNGSFTVASITSPTSFVYYTTAVASGLTTTSANVYVRPQAQFLHRAFDGGVIFSSNSNSNYETAIRQTRRYFRYQSGKGIQISSGTILKPNLQVDVLTGTGTTVTVQTKEKHNLLPGTQITVSSSTPSEYNGTFTVTNVTGFNTFTYTSATTITSSPAAGTFYVSVTAWTGASNRLGMFDNQNGVFWEFDGQVLSAVRRSSIYQVAGKATVTNGSTFVQQTSAAFPTIFSKQLAVNDQIVIRGQSYRIIDIDSDSTLNIAPAYRGATAQNVVITKTVDLRIPSSSFNIDKLDGTGPSGYTIDLSKMQMFYIDYTWYGAGFVRWGVRGPNGNVVYVHKMQNNNVNTEAYMRSGNLPGRYESSTVPAYTTNPGGASYGSSDTTLNVASTTGFYQATVANPGTLQIRGNKAALSVTAISGNGSQITFTASNALTAGDVVVITGATTTAYNGTYTVLASGLTLSSFVVTGTATGTTSTATAVVQTSEFVNYTGQTATSFTGVTREKAGVTGLFLSIAAGSNVANVISLTGLQIGQRVFDLATGYVPDGTYITNINTGALSITLSAAVTGANPTVTVAPMSQGVAQGFIYSSTAPTVIENAFPTFAPTISHWGTSVIMDGRFDDDKSLLFTYGQTLFTNIAAGTNKALFSIRVAPSVDNGIPAVFGARELINRMQLVLRALDITTRTAGANMLVTATLNGLPSSATTWNPITVAAGVQNSSLAQIADYSGGTTTVSGGEVTGGFFVATTGSVSLETVRDLGNSILGGGTTTANSGIYPDGPDVLTISVTNLGAAAVDVLGRLSWTEAQA